MDTSVGHGCRPPSRNGGIIFRGKIPSEYWFYFCSEKNNFPLQTITGRKIILWGFMSGLQSRAWTRDRGFGVGVDWGCSWDFEPQSISQRTWMSILQLHNCSTLEVRNLGLSESHSQSPEVYPVIFCQRKLSIINTTHQIRYIICIYSTGVKVEVDVPSLRLCLFFRNPDPNSGVSTKNTKNGEIYWGSNYFRVFSMPL